MPAATKHILIEMGATFRLSAIWKDKITGQPIDLTGYTARMHVRSTLLAADPIIELNTANGRIALGGTAGTIDLHITAADTQSLPASDGCVYDLELVSPTGDVVRLLKGNARIDQDVTR